MPAKDMAIRIVFIIVIKLYFPGKAHLQITGFMLVATETGTDDVISNARGSISLMKWTLFCLNLEQKRIDCFSWKGSTTII